MTTPTTTKRRCLWFGHRIRRVAYGGLFGSPPTWEGYACVRCKTLFSWTAP